MGSGKLGLKAKSFVVWLWLAAAGFLLKVFFIFYFFPCGPLDIKI